MFILMFTKMHKKLGILFFVIVILITSTISVNAVIVTKKSSNYFNLSKSSDLANWTVMLYHAFDNHRDSEKDFTYDLLKNIGSDKDFNLISLYDGTKQGDTNLFYIEKDLVVPLDWYEIESDMGHADTLENFIKIAKYYYPAEKYALFVSSTHGSGWQGLACDTFGTGTFKKLSLLNMSDYKTVLKEVTENGTEKIDVVGFEICTTASVEVACQISPYVDYMIGTEEHGFGPSEYSYDGIPLEWNFSYFLKYLKENSDISPENFSEIAVDSYTPGLYIPKIGNIIDPPDFYPIIKYKTTMSATNLSAVSDLKVSVKNLAENLSTNIQDSREEIKQARINTREYGKLYRKYYFLSSRTNFILQLDPMGYDCFIDIYDFADNLREATSDEDLKDACQSVMQNLEGAVIANKVLEEDDSHGLFIYFPEQKIQYDQSIWRVIGNPQFRNIPFSYEKLDFSEDTGWNEFLKAYLNI